MDRSNVTLAQLARGIAVRFVQPAVIDAALIALGTRADIVLSELTTERRSTLINHFVRLLRNTGIQTATRVEHAMLEAASCRTAEKRVISLKDAISLIAVRNLIHQMATAVGIGWNDSMKLQSALSDISRFIIEKGGGKVEIKDTGSALVFLIDSLADLTAFSPPQIPSPSWLASTLNLAQGFRTTLSGGGTHFEFWYARPHSMVA